jgi:hypothetical protein
MKRILFIATIACIFAFSATTVAFADAGVITSTSSTVDISDSGIMPEKVPLVSGIVYLSDGSSIETVIEIPKSSALLRAASSTRTGSKTVNYKNSAGVVLWYVKVTGAFTYNGSTSTCTSSTVTATSNSSLWKISSKSASKSGNKATAKATAKQYKGSTVIGTITQTVTLTCSAGGTLS